MNSIIDQNSNIRMNMFGLCRPLGRVEDSYKAVEVTYLLNMTSA